jgi:hypothetical protein
MHPGQQALVSLSKHLLGLSPKAFCRKEFLVKIPPSFISGESYCFFESVSSSKTTP